MKIHPSVTPERVEAAVEREQTSLDNPGFCIRLRPPPVFFSGSHPTAGPCRAQLEPGTVQALILLVHASSVAAWLAHQRGGLWPSGTMAERGLASPS